MNLVEGILAQMNRVRELAAQYDALPGGAGRFGAFLMRHEIQQAERALGSGDVVEMMRAYKALEEFE